MRFSEKLQGDISRNLTSQCTSLCQTEDAQMNQEIIRNKVTVTDLSYFISKHTLKWW